MLTDTQKKQIKAALEVARGTYEPNLSPEEEKLYAAQSEGVKNLVNRVLDGVANLLRDIFDIPPPKE